MVALRPEYIFSSAYHAFESPHYYRWNYSPWSDCSQCTWQYDRYVYTVHCAVLWSHRNKSNPQGAIGFPYMRLTPLFSSLYAHSIFLYQPLLVPSSSYGQGIFLLPGSNDKQKKNNHNLVPICWTDYICKRYNKTSSFRQ